MEKKREGTMVEDAEAGAGARIDQIRWVYPYWRNTRKESDAWAMFPSSSSRELAPWALVADRKRGHGGLAI